MTQNYVTLRGILKNIFNMLRKITDKKQNCLGSNPVEDLFVNCLCQKIVKFRAKTNRMKIAFSVSRPLNFDNFGLVGEILEGISFP